MDDKSKIKDYSKQYYENMFSSFTKVQGSFIMDRGHISEAVFSNMYRDYDGSYVFDLELKHNINDDNTFLIYLYDNPKSVMSREDGDSLSTTEAAIQEEINKFKCAVDKSNIKNKLVVYIQDFDLDTKKVSEYVIKWLETNMKGSYL
jgi:hypothetical protein